jgi:hypothetical protein
MHKPLRLSLLLVAWLFVFAQGTARAEAPEPSEPPPAPSAVQATRTGEWGWWIVGAGLVAGTALTAYGLTFECSDTDMSCRKAASVAIWGGAGVAALASAVGLAVVQAGRRTVKIVPTVSFDPAAPRFGAVLRASF